MDEILGFRVGDKILAPQPFNRPAEIIGFRYHTHHMSGRTSLVADYVTDDNKRCSDPVETIRKTNPGGPLNRERCPHCGK